MRPKLLAFAATACLALSAVTAGTATAGPPMSPGLVPAMQRDLGLTAAQARARLADEAVASRVLPAAQQAAGAAYGGAWFDPGRGRLVVGITDPAAARSVENTGALTTPVAASAARLDAVKAAIDAGGPAPASVSGWHVDHRAGSVVVTVQEGASGPELAAFLDRARAAGPVTVATGPKPVSLAAGTVGGDPYYTGNVRCSIGFSVHGGFVTAGHCGRAGAEVYGWDRSRMGTFHGSSFPGNDYAYVGIGHGWWTVPVVLGWGTVSDALVRGSWVAPVGTSVCRSGSTTHWHCGTVLGHNQTVNYAEGAVHQMTKTSVCAQGGDSGGSFITGDQAQGVTSGGWGNCSSGGETWFQPVNEILQAYGLTLHTA
ncbi:S1 family peptidase [Amycolatopsis suaedae]|uniref:S1 family peptidase n=1 Tax=Amycolatopsis suaedae TaxID=2510978 RepID=A0A4Q7JGK6_9PSEU|nr:S1 family peptidase [Amycolatopsis suaedae]RZQ65964.1 S1 family peptidase [Amycolatopsis suaedae]